MSKKDKDITLYNIYRSFATGQWLEHIYSVYIVTTDDFDKWYESTKGTSYIINEDNEPKILEKDDFDVECVDLVTSNKLVKDIFKNNVVEEEAFKGKTYGLENSDMEEK